MSIIKFNKELDKMNNYKDYIIGNLISELIQLDNHGFYNINAYDFLSNIDNDFYNIDNLSIDTEIKIYSNYFYDYFNDDDEYNYFVKNSDTDITNLIKYEKIEYALLLNGKYIQRCESFDYIERVKDRFDEKVKSIINEIKEEVENINEYNNLVDDFNNNKMNDVEKLDFINNNYDYIKYCDYDFQVETFDNENYEDYLLYEFLDYFYDKIEDFKNKFNLELELLNMTINKFETKKKVSKI